MSIEVSWVSGSFSLKKQKVLYRCDHSKIGNIYIWWWKRIRFPKIYVCKYSRRWTMSKITVKFIVIHNHQEHIDTYLHVQSYILIQKTPSWRQDVSTISSHLFTWFECILDNQHQTLQQMFNTMYFLLGEGIDWNLTEFAVTFVNKLC